MQIAIHYAPATEALLQAGKIEIDLYKCPDWPEFVAEVQEKHPVYVHFPLRVGRGTLDQVDWDNVEHFLKTTETRYINLHLGPHSDDFPGMDIDTQDASWQEGIAEAMLKDIDWLKARYGADQIILENVPWDPSESYAIPRPAILPEVINQVVVESGCGFLFDTAHARISALYLECDPLDYLDQLPGHLMRELHVTGTLYTGAGRVWLDHHPMQAFDWELVERTMRHIQQGKWRAPDVVALEYGGVGPLFESRTDPDVIARDMPRLTQLVRQTEAFIAEFRMQSKEDAHAK